MVAKGLIWGGVRDSGMSSEVDFKQYPNVLLMLRLAFFAVVGLGVLARLRWVTRCGFEPKGIVVMRDFLRLSCLNPAATAAFISSVAPSSGSAQSDILQPASRCQGYPERSVGLRVPIIRSAL